MRAVGIVGGIGPESTVYYYQRIIKEFQKRTKSKIYPTINIISIDMTEMLYYEENREYDKLVGMLKNAVDNLQRAYSDFAVIASNTPHVVFERLETVTTIKLISIVESTCEYIQKRGYKKALLTGTLYTMQENFYEKYAKKYDFDLIVPCTETMVDIQDVIFPELEEGIIVPEKKKKYINIVESYKKEKVIDCVILGCTELPLMITDKDISVPTINTSEIHVQKIVDEILTETNQQKL
jgi:aspartate racemase